jgi:hypothetical protein
MSPSDIWNLAYCFLLSSLVVSSGKFSAVTHRGRNLGLLLLVFLALPSCADSRAANPPPQPPPVVFEWPPPLRDMVSVVREAAPFVMQRIDVYQVPADRSFVATHLQAGRACNWIETTTAGDRLVWISRLTAGETPFLLRDSPIGVVFAPGSRVTAVAHTPTILTLDFALLGYLR